MNLFRHKQPAAGARRVLVPFTRGNLEPTVLAAAIRIAKAEAELKRLAAVQRKKIDVQKLASQVGRTLQRLKAHKYFSYSVDALGQLQWERKGELIVQEAQQDGWYLLHTNEPADKCRHCPPAIT